MSTNNIKGVTTLKSIVSNVLLDDGVSGDMGEYFRYLNWAARILKELNLFHMRVVNTARIMMSDINTIDLPDDYMMFESLGIPVNGRIWVFTKDNKLIIPATEDCGILTLDVVEGEGVVIGDGMDLYGYGLSGGRNEYYYKIDEPNNRIIINGFTKVTVTLTYVGTGIKIGEETIIPKIAEEAMIAGIHMLHDRRDKTVPFIQKQQSSDIYDGEVEKLRFVQGPTLEELSDAIYETIYQSVKR